MSSVLEIHFRLWNYMIGKSFLVTSVFVLLVLSASGALVVSAWSASASFTCMGTSVVTDCSSSGQGNPSFSVGTNLTDTAIIKDPNGIDGSCNASGGSGCVTGDVNFTIYQGSSCSGTQVEVSGEIPPTGEQYPGIFSYSYTFGAAGSYSILAQYKGNYDDNEGWYSLPCEPLTISSPVVTPQFPVGSLLAILAPLAAKGLYVGNKKGFKFSRV